MGNKNSRTETAVAPPERNSTFTEDNFAACQKSFSRAKESSRVAFSMATLVINVLPWDPAHHPSGVPSHFVPFEFVLEEVLPFLPTNKFLVKEVSCVAGDLVDCITFSYVDVDGITAPQKDFGEKGGKWGYLHPPGNLHPVSFVLGEEEYIERVSFHHGAAWSYHSLFAVKFVTNLGRSSLSYGNNRSPLHPKGPSWFGEKSIIKAKPGHQITGLVRGDGFCGTIADVIQIPLDAFE